MNKKKLIRIIVPVCIVIAVAAIWFMKNVNSNFDTSDMAAGTNPNNSDKVYSDVNFTLEATSVELDVLKAYGLPIIIDFGADSCIPCKEMAPVLKTLNSEMRGKAIIKFVDVWKNRQAANGFPVQVIPTQILINSDGTPYVPSAKMDIEFTMYALKENNGRYGGKQMTGILEGLSNLIASSGWLAPLLALVAGILTSLTPCALSGIPLVVGYVGGTGQRSTKRAFLLSIVFAIGAAVTFTVLGVTASLAGRLIGTSTSWWYIALGVLMVVMALQTWGLFEIIPSSYLISKNTKKGFFGAFVAGILAGIFSSPCSTPVLIVLLAIVAGKGSVLWGILLLLLYSIGHGILAVLAGTSIGFVQKLSASKNYGRISNVLKIVMGSLILLLGFYMFYIGF